MQFHIFNSQFERKSFVQMGSLVYIIEDDYTTEMIVYHYKELF